MIQRKSKTKLKCLWKNNESQCGEWDGLPRIPFYLWNNRQHFDFCPYCGGHLIFEGTLPWEIEK